MIPQNTGNVYKFIVTGCLILVMLMCIYSESMNKKTRIVNSLVTVFNQVTSTNVKRDLVYWIYIYIQLKYCKKCTLLRCYVPNLTYHFKRSQKYSKYIWKHCCRDRPNVTSILTIYILIGLLWTNDYVSVSTKEVYM